MAGGDRIITWDSENRPSSISHVSGNETCAYDAGGEFSLYKTREE